MSSSVTSGPGPNGYPAGTWALYRAQSQASTKAPDSLTAFTDLPSIQDISELPGGSIKTGYTSGETSGAAPEVLAEISVFSNNGVPKIVATNYTDSWSALSGSEVIKKQMKDAAWPELVPWGRTFMESHIREQTFVEIVSKNMKKLNCPRRWDSKRTPQELKGVPGRYLRKRMVLAFLSAMGKGENAAGDVKPGDEEEWIKRFIISIYKNKAWIPSVHRSPANIDWENDPDVKGYLTLLRPLYEDVIHTEPPVPIRLANVEAENDDLVMGM